MELRWSNYVNDYHENGNVILFHSVNRAVNMISEEVYSQIESFFKGMTPEDEVKKLIAELYVDYFLVEKGKNERQEFIDIRNDRETQGACVVYFIPTFSCNFRCPYCIVSSTEHESVCHEVFPLEKELIEMASWLKKYVINHGLKKLTIELFGGEPMVGFDQNVVFLKELNSIKEQGVELVVNMISNCYLLTEEKLAVLTGLGLKNIQCTIDGPKRIHDQRRIQANGEGSFDQIIENLKMLARKHIDFTIRINIDEENAPYICELIEYLHELGFHKVGQIGLAPVDPPIEDGALTGHTKETMSYMEKIYRCLADHQFRFLMWETFCGNGLRDFFVICPDGKLYNCPSYAGMKGYEVGDVFENGFYENRKKVHELSEHCYDCSLVGVCAGGCYFTKHIHNLGEQYCLKLTHSTMVKGYMLAKYSQMPVKEM